MPANLKNDLDKFFRFTNFTNTKDQVIVQPTDEVDGGADEAGNNGEDGVDDWE